MILRVASVIIVLALAILVTPLAVEAQQVGKVYRIGYLTAGGGVEQAFQDAMRQLGYLEGQNIVIEGRFAERKLERLPDLAADLVRLKVDVIVTITTPAAQAAKNATTTIPIVMAGSAQPVELGLVASLARPGGNVTGVTNNPGPGFTGKWLQLLKEAAPTIRRVATIHDLSIAPEVRGWAEMQDAARILSLTLLSSDVRTSDDFDTAFTAIARERADALIVLPNFLNGAHTKRIVEFATKNRLPTMFGDGNAVKAGGFMSYWTNWGDLRRRAAIYVDKILKGAKPAELPVEEPTKFELVINLKTAKALGLALPQSILIRADQVIE
ncbi:MAG: ABC transporter substrate-binding protein [candidate division NC10 bacterium]|nr:ABC transporter substrate-binding protein [candidate division NC10 bacterium]